MATYCGQTVDLLETFTGALGAGFVETDVDSLITLNDATHTRDGANTLKVNYAGWTAAESLITCSHAAVDHVSIGFWYRTGSNYFDYGATSPMVVIIRALFGDLIVRVWDKKDNSDNQREFALYNETAYTYAGKGFVQDNTWYWLTFQINRGATSYFSVYNEDHSLLEAVSFTASATQPDGEQFPDMTAYQNCAVTYGPYIVDYTNFVFPLFGWVGGGTAITWTPHVSKTMVFGR